MLKPFLFASLIIVVFSGCQQAVRGPDSVSAYLHDELFPGHESVGIETMEQVFAIDDNMKAFVNQQVKVKDTQQEQIKTLARGIFEHSDIALLYQNDANTTAIETFANKAANCLSLTIMTYALADYAGFGVSFQQVNIPELWVRRDGASMLNRHINLKVYERPDNHVYLITRRDYTVDFNQLNGSRWFPERVIDKNRVLSMFYNNKGVDALLVGDQIRAYAYFKKGIITDPTLVDNYTNLGLLYRRNGKNDWAKANYLLSLKLAPDDGTTLENLASMYAETGRLSEANKIKRNLNKKRQENPYYHYLLGEEALDVHDLHMAKRHFREAISLQGRNHEFYFAMAKTLYLLGETESSQHYLKLAKKYSDSRPEELRYQMKLDSYSRLHNDP